MMNKNEIKSKAWEEIERYISSDDETFNSSACSFKISNDYNLVVWCDIDREFDKNNERYFIISIRYNPHDELFGNDISNLEYATIDTSKEELEKAIDILTDSLQNKTLIKSQYGGYQLTQSI